MSHTVNAESLHGTRPNVILIITDDMGYGDLSCYGSEVIRTPRLDQMAREGVKFTNFHMTAAQCTPSRASILTGCYPQRVNLEGVLVPGQDKGLSTDEITVAELLKDSGYATALVGKWHLGDSDPFLPLDHGFEHYYGIPYSNNMEPFVFYKDREIVEHNYDQSTLTQRLTDHAMDWIGDNRERPFFLCLWHPMPHMPLAATKDFLGTSAFGLYGDVCQELDFHTGRLLDCLKEQGLEDDTLVVFSSDNGPWQPRSRPDPETGGSAGPYRGHKANEFEGGLRVPCIVRWPGKIPANRQSDTFWTGMDILPTLCRLAGVDVPQDRVIDGKDAIPVLTGAAQSLYESFFYYHYNELNGVSIGEWKYMVPLSNRDEHYFHYKVDPGEALALYGDPDAQSIPESLFNLRDEAPERVNRIGEQPEIAGRARSLMQAMREDLGDERTGTAGSGRRPAGSLYP